MSVTAVPLPAQEPPPAPAAVPPPLALDTEALGVSLAAIKRRLAAESQTRSQGASPLKLEYRVDVFGAAPALRFFQGQDLRFGGVAGSAPTHADMLYMFTPRNSARRASTS